MRCRERLPSTVKLDVQRSQSNLREWWERETACEEVGEVVVARLGTTEDVDATDCLEGPATWLVLMSGEWKVTDASMPT